MSPRNTGGVGVKSLPTPPTHCRSAHISPRGSTRPTDERVCAWCAAPLPPDRGGRPRRFCTATCRYAAKDSARYVARGTQVTARCERCGESFTYLSSTHPRSLCTVCRPLKATGREGEA